MMLLDKKREKKQANNIKVNYFCWSAAPGEGAPDWRNKQQGLQGQKGERRAKAGVVIHPSVTHYRVIPVQ